MEGQKLEMSSAVESILDLDYLAWNLSSEWGLIWYNF